MWKYYDAAKNATQSAASSASGYVSTAKEKASVIAAVVQSEATHALETIAYPKLSPLDEPLYDENEAFEYFKGKFKLLDKNDVIEKVVNEDKTVATLYKEGVPDTLSHEEFWMRYFFRSDDEDALKIFREIEVPSDRFTSEGPITSSLNPQESDFASLEMEVLQLRSVVEQHENQVKELEEKYVLKISELETKLEMHKRNESFMEERASGSSDLVDTSKWKDRATKMKKLKEESDARFLSLEKEKGSQLEALSRKISKLEIEAEQSYSNGFSAGKLKAEKELLAAAQVSTVENKSLKHPSGATVSQSSTKVPAPPTLGILNASEVENVEDDWGSWE